MASTLWRWNGFSLVLVSSDKQHASCICHYSTNHSWAYFPFFSPIHPCYAACMVHIDNSTARRM